MSESPDLDALAAKFDGNHPEVVKEPEVIEEEVEEEIDDTPAGFKTLEEYVADGGDPEMYRGKKAYEAEHNRIEENKLLRTEMRSIKDNTRLAVEALGEWKADQTKVLREQLVAELEEAREEEDLNKALAAQTKITELDNAPKPAAAQQPENPVIQAFRVANPLINPGDDRFNAEFTTDVEAIYNGIVNQLNQGGRVNLTDGQMQRALTKAMKDTKELHIGLFESPKNKRITPANPNRRASRSTTKEGKVADYVLKNPRNPANADAASQIKNLLKDKYGDDVANAFEKNLMGDD